MTIRIPLLAVMLWCGAIPLCTFAQAPTNMELYQDHAVNCLIAVPDTTRALSLESPGVMSFLESALISRWTQQGVDVFRTDSLLSHPLPSLKYDVESARVSYEAVKRRQLERTVSLALQFSWTSRTGQILRSERCAQSSNDLILRRDVARVESPAYPETTASLPAGSWTRRYLEPIALGAATALTVFLFFNLRTSRAQSGS